MGKVSVVKIEDENVDAAVRAAVEVDFIINLPQLYTHGTSYVSLGLKNIKGILYGKEQTHMMGLEDAIVDLNLRFPSILTILDAKYGKEWRTQTRHDYNLILASEDVVALDYLGTKLMGFEPEKVKHLVIAKNRGVGSFEDIEMLGEEIDKHIFELPWPMGDICEWGDLRVKVVEEKACSGCWSELLWLMCGPYMEGVKSKIKEWTVLMGPEAGKPEEVMGEVLVLQLCEAFEGCGHLCKWLSAQLG